MYIVSTSQKQMHIVDTSLVLWLFLLSSTILFYLIYLFICIFYLFLFLFCFLMVFFQTHAWIFTKPRTVGNCTHCCISYSEEIKYIVDNSLSIGKAGEYSQEQTKKKVTKVLQPFCG